MKYEIKMESYSFAKTSARRYRIVDGQKLQVNKKQEILKKIWNSKFITEETKTLNQTNILILVTSHVTELLQ
jgi:hypothetical protein